MSLTSQEIRQFEDRGYVVKAGIYTRADLQPLKDGISEIIDSEARRLRAEGLLDDIYEDEGFETRLACIYRADEEAGKTIARAITGKGGGGFSGSGIFQTIRHPGLVSCIESLVGPDIIGSSVYRIRVKMPDFDHGEVPWHQDSGYFMAHCDRYLIVTCWVPLVDATIENGCLYVLPGGHRSGMLRHYTGGHAGFLEIPEDELPVSDPVPVEMKAGDALFLTNLTPHASFKNRTDMVRWSVDLRYQGVDAPNNVDETPDAITPERETVTMACYPPEADFVIKDTTNPEREVHSPDAFHKLRELYEQARPHGPGRGWTPMVERKR
jgi:hypothetical protein